MNGLPNDIIAIIQRYVFDYFYKQVRIDYDLTYLNKNHMVGDHFVGISWSDQHQYFICWNGVCGTLAANWRQSMIESHKQYKHIKKIWGNAIVAPLPANYF